MQTKFQFIYLLALYYVDEIEPDNINILTGLRTEKCDLIINPLINYKHFSIYKRFRIKLRCIIMSYAIESSLEATSVN